MFREESLECKSDKFCVASEVKNAKEEFKQRLVQLRMWRSRAYFSTGDSRDDYNSIPVLYAA